MLCYTFRFLFILVLDVLAFDGGRHDSASHPHRESRPPRGEEKDARTSDSKGTRSRDPKANSVRELVGDWTMDERNGR